jgi:hypothetical protein
VRTGEPLASVFASDKKGIDIGLTALKEAIVIGEKGRLMPLITHRVTADGVTAL